MLCCHFSHQHQLCPGCHREAVVVTVYCFALFLEPWRLGKTAGAASYALQGKRRLPGHLKVFLDLTPEASIATASLLLRGGKQAQGANRLRSRSIPVAPFPPRLFTAADKQQMSAAAMAPAIEFPFHFLPCSPEGALQRNALDSFNSLCTRLFFTSLV